MDAPRCAATSKQTGERCKRRPHPGATVCVVHGAGAPQVQKTARERLDALVAPSIATLAEVIKLGTKSKDTPSVVRACITILDRCGYPATSHLAIHTPMEAKASLARLLGVEPGQLPEE